MQNWVPVILNVGFQKQIDIYLYISLHMFKKLSSHDDGIGG